MKYYLSSIVSFIIFLSAQYAYADVYYIHVKQSADNVYVSQEGYIITTRKCTAQPTSFEEAVIIYPNKDYVKKHTLIFTYQKSTPICDIQSVQKGATFPHIAKE